MDSYENMTVRTDGKKLIIEIADYTKDYGPSPSGKTNRIATSNGIKQVTGAPGVLVGINIMRKVK